MGRCNVSRFNAAGSIASTARSCRRRDVPRRHFRKAPWSLPTKLAKTVLNTKPLGRKGNNGSAPIRFSRADQRPVRTRVAPRGWQARAAPSPPGAARCALGPASAVVLRQESPWLAAARWTFQWRFACAPWCPSIAIIDDLRRRSGRGARATTTRPCVRLVDPGFLCEPGMIGVADRATGAPEKYRAAPKALAIGLDAGGDRVSGLRAFDHDHTHVSLPWIWFLFAILKQETGRLDGALVGAATWGASAHLARCLIEHGAACSWRGLFQPAGVALLNETWTCTAFLLVWWRTLATCFLIGSPVSVAIFWASSHNSLFWAEALSKALRACAVDKVKISVTDLLPRRWAKKSIAEAVLAFEISMTLSP